MNNNTENKNNQQEKGKGQASQNSLVKRTFAKRWTFPVIYLAASVLIVGLMYAKSKDVAPFAVDKTNTKTTTEQVVGPQVPSSDQSTSPTASATSFIWPVGDDGADATISMGFFHDSDTDAQKAREVVAYNNTFYPNQGVNIGLKSDAAFTVVAAAKGKVTNVAQDPLMGNIVEIDNGNGYTTYYASLSNVEVKKGDNVLQGQPIAKSGNNKLEKDQKNHLHFELRKEGSPVDPNTVLSKKPVGDVTRTSGSAASTPASTDKGASKTSATTGSQSSTTTSSQPASQDQYQTTLPDQSASTSSDQSSAVTSSSTDNSDQASTDTSASTDSSSDGSSSSDQSTTGDSGANN